MSWLWGLGLLSGFYPIWRAWQAVRGSTLRSAVAWSALAWAAWVAAFLAWPQTDVGVYLALCLTGCAGVAVLGARRPGVGAWNFVVLGLLAALLRPLVEGLGSLRLETPHLAFLGIVLAVGVGNYLPTRNGWAALALAAGCGVELARLVSADLPWWGGEAGRLLLAVSPWLALLKGGPSAGSEVDRLWLTFRDNYGLVWAQRAREQFNKSAANSGWPVALGWGGLRRGDGEGPAEEKVVGLLKGVLKRFGTEAPSPARGEGGARGEPGA